MADKSEERLLTEEEYYHSMEQGSEDWVWGRGSDRLSKTLCQRHQVLSDQDAKSISTYKKKQVEKMEAEKNPFAFEEGLIIPNWERQWKVFEEARQAMIRLVKGE